MSMKFNFLLPHTDFFPLKTWELCERFHQDISQMEKGQSGKWSPNMWSDYCRRLIRETPNGEYGRQKKME
jgi:hypothetical protein